MGSGFDISSGFRIRHSGFVIPSSLGISSFVIARTGISSFVISSQLLTAPMVRFNTLRITSPGASLPLNSLNCKPA